MSLYYREQKHICGKDYATAGYMEVDLYPVTPKQHKASRRAKKKEACTLAQQTYNDNRSKRYHVQLVNANFGKGDFSWTGTYDDDHLPAPGDTKRADMDWTNYIKRVYRWCDKNGVERPKWVAATEYTTVMADGTICGRHHHHAIIQHTEGLTRDAIALSKSIPKILANSYIFIWFSISFKSKNTSKLIFIPSSSALWYLLAKTLYIAGLFIVLGLRPVRLFVHWQSFKSC